jgi:DNA-binding MarR family transcriptional regulator
MNMTDRHVHMTIITERFPTMVLVAPLDKNGAALSTKGRRASDLVRARIVEGISADTGLSDPDFGVLTRVGEFGGGAMRQNQLAESMGFQRSRLSDHLTRMEEWGLVRRRQAGDGVEVVVTDAGRDLVAKARRAHAAAVRRHLLEPLTANEQRSLGSMLEKLIRRDESNP